MITPSEIRHIKMLLKDFGLVRRASEECAEIVHSMELDEISYNTAHRKMMSLFSKVYA